MHFKKKGNVYYLRLEKGDKVIENLLKFLEEQGIKSGFFSAIGAVDHVVLAHYNVETKEYSEKELKGQREIVSLIGNISEMDSKPYIHAHICVGDDKMGVKGGHCKEANVSATCEISLVTSEVKLGRKFSEEIGLNLWDF